MEITPQSFGFSSAQVVNNVKLPMGRAFQELCHLLNQCQLEDSKDRSQQMKDILKNCHQSLLKTNEATKLMLEGSESFVLTLTETIGNLDNTKRDLEKKHYIESLQVVQYFLVSKTIAYINWYQCFLKCNY